MEIIITTLIWGLIIGIIHYVILGILYQNPFTAKFYKNEENLKSPGFKIWANTKKYMIFMFLGTQIEIFILTFAYLFLRNYLPFENLTIAFILAGMFSAIRIYPRFWNMWIQSTYPRKLLAVEFINGIISTFVVVIRLYLLPV